MLLGRKGFMKARNSELKYLIFVLLAASTVYVVGHWNAIVDPYVINDDVRQQVYWMQKWYDEELFPDDLLTLYARYYVPWGIKAVYRLGAPFMVPVQFSKVITGILYVITACFIFGLGLEFKDKIVALVIVCCYFFFTTFLRKISGGLSQSFGFPLLCAYLFFLARNNLLAAAFTIMFASVLNPYIFVLTSATHGIYLIANYGALPVNKLLGRRSESLVDEVSTDRGPLTGENPIGPPNQIAITKLFLLNVPILVGAFLMSLKYILLKPDGIGNLVTWSQIVGHVEYTAAGRYQIFPVPSIFYELTMPWRGIFPFDEWGHVAGWIGMAFILALSICAWTHKNFFANLHGFRVYAYLLPASLLMWCISYVVLMRLFIPGRYLEFSLTVFYCVFTGVTAKLALDRLGLKRIIFPWVVVSAVFVGALRSHELGIYDYSEYQDLYRFLRTTPKSSLIAGHPVLMDPFPAYSHRKAFVTYELSHTWIDSYWEIIEKRTFDFFKAYYSDNPDDLRQFCDYYGIDYLLVREEDFSPRILQKGEVYFEPFRSQIQELVRNKSQFAALSAKAFPVVYRSSGIRVLKMR
ncbi:MAG: hypothetical protein HY912_22600 [Desulfomonile tiedjei]|uniref:Uncharacterized protein n=1 Tax=Desulfomonile tiedjei TaxID=2358 RepID=A0A9D6V7E6_9BACT|nr:hypothetical protein [Desulfomonile tiedjei]